MSIKVNSRCAKCRRAGEKLMLKGEKCMGPKCAFGRRSYAPGAHGPNQKRIKLSGYGKQLKEKQKVKRMYGILERQFSNLVAEASKKVGDTSKILTSFLESRLDNTVFRAGFAKARLSARQLVSHGLIAVDGKKVDVPSFRVKPGMVVAVKEGAKNKKVMENMSEQLSKAETPSWISVDAKSLSAKVLNAPTLDNANFNAQSIIEFYSR
jgi:small subunit ribosomal protein S4